MTRTAHRWQALPGSFDALHARHTFLSSNRYGIPDLLPEAAGPPPAWLAPYRTRVRAETPPTDGAIHFFLDDYRFETVWRRPWKALTALRPYTTLLSPDFSLYRDWPRALQLWNVYRSRWCGCFWQAEGFTIIPTVSWSDAGSYDFCFLGLPRRGVVAVSAVGVDLSDPLTGQLFRDGFREMVDRLAPRRVLSYGPLPDDCARLVDAVVYPTRWAGIRAARRTARNRGAP